MSLKLTNTAVVLAAVASPVVAQGITGGSLGIEWGAPTDLETLGSTTYRSAVEYSFNHNMGISADLSGYSFNSTEDNGTSLTLHGIYHLSDSASAGVFVGADSANGTGNPVYGIEAGSEILEGHVEGYVGLLDSDNAATLFGISGEYDVINGFAAIGSFDLSSSDDGDGVNRFAIGTEYTMVNGPSFFAEVGQTNLDTSGVSSSATFIGVGAKVAFGAGRGTTFGPRSAFETTSGF